jgi:creatinine amidohydrolase
LRLAHMGKLQIGLVHVFKLDESIWQEYTRDAADLHANAAETALMLHLHPERVHMDRLTDSDDPDRTGSTVFSYPVAQTSLNGVTGTPSRANALEGKALFEQMVSALTRTVAIAIDEKPPLSAEHWQGLPEVDYE